MYPNQSGIEIHPLSRYDAFGLDGMLSGLLPAFSHVFHSAWLFRFSFRTIALADGKGSMLPGVVCPLYPRKSGHEMNPSSRYALSGLDGIFHGRFPALPHAFHSLALFSLSFRAITLASGKGTISLRVMRPL